MSGCLALEVAAMECFTSNGWLFSNRIAHVQFLSTQHKLGCGACCVWSFCGLVVGCNNEQLHVSIDREAGILIYIPLSKKSCVHGL